MSKELSKLNELISLNGFDGVLIDMADYAHTQAMAAQRDVDPELTKLWLDREVATMIFCNKIRELVTK